MSSFRESGTLGTYQRYKLGQAQFQKWLKQTSDKLRLGSARPPTGPAHLQNSTAKKESNQAGKGSQLKGNPKTASAVHWSQLESMAQTVIDYAEPEQIPRSAISILRDVVYLRKKTADLFGQAATRADSEVLRQKNSAHEHIIQVLERVLHRFEAFLSNIRPSSQEAGPNEDGRLGMNDINNMFEHLHVEQSHEGENEDREEISDAEVTVAKRAKKFQKKGGKKPKQKKQPKEQRVQQRTPGSQDNSWVDTFKWVEEEEDEEEDDYYMLIYCFFQDFNSIRTYVSDRWTEYFYHKSVSLDTLAVVTNAACEMFHEMEYELVKVLRDTPRLAEYEFMLDTLFFQYGLDHVDYSGEHELTDSERNYKILAEADWLGFFAYSNIVQILDFVPPGKVPMVPSSAMKQPKYGLHEFEDFRDFTKDAIFDFFPEICIIKAMKTNDELPMIVCAQDELTLDFEDIFRVRDYSSATVFGLSLYIDIRYILEDQISDAFHLAQTTAVRTKTILEDQLPSIRGPWDLKKECRFRLAEAESFILQDFLGKDKARRFEEKGVMEEFERHLLLKKDPVWSGLLDFRCRLVLNNLGYRFINESPVVLGAAFAYAASLINEVQDLHWPQMDQFFRVHDKDRILRGPLPPKLAPIDLLRRFVDHNLAGTDDPFIGPSKPLEALHRRYGSENSHSRQSMAYLRDIIRDKFDMKAVNPFSRQAAILAPGTDERQSPPDAVVKRGNPGVAGAQIAPRQISQPTRVSPVQLLEILDETTTSLLENELAIDLFQLHTESVRLLQKLLGEFSSEVESDTPSMLDESTRTERLPLLLPIIYRSMADGNTVEIGKRFGKVIGEFCSSLG
ncbi:hypothetical protein F4820DRAFT_411134 [Hypoxylon rubiginosum]|uniref:Uncharacterized protein n=1 Tax=Hypoxylon rubiginosum TaxID=110542 RepID=A0ACB9ZB02_9PEZI|nr:hypothetical protein F4820DRAFT_411134 [Hypoxylon rubiginosum]